LHAFVAAWNAGPVNVTPLTVTAELPGDVFTESPGPPGPEVGSGKFETPCARMHWAIANTELVDPVALLGLLEDPQPARPAMTMRPASIEQR
jgi:hypothetical protein